jgi:hypothetical protein
MNVVNFFASFAVDTVSNFSHLYFSCLSRGCVESQATPPFHHVQLSLSVLSISRLLSEAISVLRCGSTMKAPIYRAFHIAAPLHMSTKRRPAESETLCPCFFWKPTSDTLHNSNTTTVTVIAVAFHLVRVVFHNSYPRMRYQSHAFRVAQNTAQRLPPKRLIAKRKHPTQRSSCRLQVIVFTQVDTCQIRLHHVIHQIHESDFTFPAELPLCLRRVAQQLFHLKHGKSRPKKVQPPGNLRLTNGKPVRSIIA